MTREEQLQQAKTRGHLTLCFRSDLKNCEPADKLFLIGHTHNDSYKCCQICHLCGLGSVKDCRHG